MPDRPGPQDPVTERSTALDRRRAGVLLHISSLPGIGPVGDLGPQAHRFVDFLHDAGLSVWQMLPVGPTQEDGSPYQSSSMHAGNPRFIALEPLQQAGWLEADTLALDSVDDDTRQRLLQQAWEQFKQHADTDQWQRLNRFISEQHHWLEDYALFRALKQEQGGQGWWCWPEPLRDRQPPALIEAQHRLAPALNYIRFEQYQFFSQWQALKQHANDRGIRLFGDMPIFVAHDSAEVWAHPQMFLLDEQGQPRVVAGVPPDYFSETGQRWGNPLYNWERMQADGFSFWLQRMQTQMQLFDLVRIDHFRGFEACWEIPAEEPNAINGRWVKVPGDALFETLYRHHPGLPLVAEDLGIITDQVTALRECFGLPGMKVLQFAFSGEADNPYLPFRHGRNAVVYTGTHDNDTTRGWYLSLSDHDRTYVDEYLGRSREAMPGPLIRAALASRAKLAIIPMQDLLGLDGSHRMNLPGTIDGNWQWRFTWRQLEPELPARLRRQVTLYGRLFSQ